ncbi:hypothetical protein EOL73_03315 [Candidatus Saccharibacteria bacterium]|nr:hypothetical protein [Candidatus Saccharibacteria bacterium]NCU40759.1 hypothetical protein [Candidatus Saccharibacteria bacterium]
MDPTFKGLAAPVPKSAKPPKFPVKVLLLVFGVLMLTMIAYVVLTGYFAGNSAYAPLELSLRMDTAARMSKDATVNIKNPSFSKVNSEISNILSSDNGEIQRLVPTGRNDPTSKKYRSAEKSRVEKLNEDLIAARNNGVFDSEYKTIIRNELVVLQKAAGKLSKRTTGDFKSALITFVDHAEIAITRLDSLN